MTNPDENKNQDNNQNLDIDKDQDLIDMIAKATPDTPVNEDHRDALRRQVLAAYDQRVAGNESVRNPLFKITGASVMKIAASFTLLAAVGVFAITAFSPTKASAFQQVAKEILKIENASFDLVSAVEYPDGRVVDMASNKVTVALPGKMRLEISGGMTMMLDFDEDKMLVLMEANRLAMLVPGISSEFGAMDQGQGRFLGDLQDHIRRAEQGNNLDGIKYEKLGEKKIGEKKAMGFRVLNINAQNNVEPAQEPADEPTSAFDIWADTETGLIIQLVYRTPAADNGTATYTYDNFVYNQKLAPGLLSLEVPEGYTLVDARQGALASPIDPGDEASSLERLVDMLKTYATIANNGVFPKTLSYEEFELGLIESWKRQFPGTPVYKDEAKREFTDPQFANFLELMNASLGFIRKLEADGVAYVYAGDGVKAGQGDRPILWFKAKDAQTYTVVYGDMQIKQADDPPVKP